MRGRSLALSILLVAGGAAACSDDGGGSDEDAQPYVDALVASLDDEDEGGPTEAQARCIGERTIEVIGVDTLEEEGITPEDVADSDGPEDLGIDLSEEQARSIGESFVDCDVDFAALFAGPDASDELVACIDENMDADLIVDAFTEQFQGDEDAADATFEEAFAGVDEACNSLAG
jgi:hypothetical protein